jgi:hypothetical protein
MSSKLAAMRFLDATWIDDQAVGRILHETGLDLREDLKPFHLQQFLNELIGQSIGIQLDALRGKEEWQKAAKHLDAVVRYHEFAAKWAQSGQVLPRIPEKTLHAIVAHRDAIEHDLKHGSNALRKRRGVWITYFLPRALGLYAAAFSKQPKTTLPKEDDLPEGTLVLDYADPAVRFIAWVVHETWRSQDAIGYKAFFEAAGVGDPSWPTMAPESVASRMTEYLRARDPEAPARVLWEGARDEYRIRIKLLKVMG